jgi:hypothetical protein
MNVCATPDISTRPKALVMAQCVRRDRLMASRLRPDGFERPT